MAKSHLVLVCPEPYTGRGGIATAAGGFIDGFQELGIDVEAISSHQTGANKLKQWGIAAKKLFGVCRQSAVKPIVWLHCGPWFSMLRKWSLGMMAKLLGAKTVIHLHSTVIEDYASSATGRFLLRIFLKSFDQVLVVTPWWGKWLHNTLNIKAQSVFNPLSISWFDREDDVLGQQRTCSSVHLVSMSRLVHGKGFELLIEAMTHLPQHYTLTIAGEGPLQPQLVAMCERLALSNRVTFAGWVEGKDKRTLLESADIFVLISKAESFGMGYIEAMSCSTPVIGLKRGPIVDVVSEDVGRLITQECATELAEAVLSITPNLNTMMVAARERACNVFHPKVIARDVCQLLTIEQ